MGVVKNLVGQKFGRLTVIEQHGYGKPNKHGLKHITTEIRRLWNGKQHTGSALNVDSDLLCEVKNEHLITF